MDSNRPLQRKRAEDPVDMTPMVDVTFLLLIFFMVTAAFGLQKAIEAPSEDLAAKTATSAWNAPEPEVVRIYDDNTIWVGGTEVLSRQQLTMELRARCFGPEGRADTDLIVVADEDCHHQTVVMVLDAGNEAGIENIRLATEDGR